MNLQLSLKKKWFDMTKAKIKPEDYREITPYWCSRLLQFKSQNIKQSNFEALFNLNNYQFVIDFINENYDLKHFDLNVMTLGYPSKGDTERILKLEHAGIEIREGNPEWGAEPGKLYFVIKHGKIL
ncbi:hypothetical protein [Chryseobacterium sp. 2VB]|uniref:hypothetical protein n=1 Tax=Chryseobacterium sp. 2VB TaxID=2502204 RepID=UPI0010F9FCB2|nr:hypothetical protein [Chryseobacterium sp. 2VB]